MLYFFHRGGLYALFADDNTLSAWWETVSKLIDTLQSESNISIDWFTKNEIIINSDEFQAIVLHRKTSNLTSIPFTIIDNEAIK